jgi:homoserine kinase
MKLTVRVPATSANLGPGFDSLGLALDIWATVTVETVRGRSRPDGSIMRLVQQGLRAVYGERQAPAIEVAWDDAIPLARGLGASAALRAAGLLAGNALLHDALDNEALLALGTKLEGHPDNMAPSLFGGLQVVLHTADDRIIHLEAPLTPDLQVVVFVPDFEMPTQESRRRLPAMLSREDAVFNVGRAALLVAALGAGRYDLLNEATQDRIHQPVRSEIFTGLVPIMSAAKQAGAAASYLSGGGSTVAAFTRTHADAVAAAMAAAANAHGFGGRSIVTRPASKGTSIIETS